VPSQSQKSLLHLWHSDDSDLKITTTVCSVILHRGMCGAGVAPLWIAQDLQKQLENPHSLLKQGAFTSKAVAVKVMASHVEEAIPVYPSRTPSPHSVHSTDPSNPVSAHGKEPPTASEAQLQTEPVFQKPLPQSARLNSPRPIETTVSPPIFTTSMTSSGKFHNYHSHTPRPDVHISADLVYPSPSPRLGGAAVSVAHVGMGSATRQGPLFGLSRGQPCLGPNGQRVDGDAAKGAHSRTSDSNTSSTSRSGGNGELAQFQTSVVEPGSLCANNEDVEDAIFSLRSEQMPGAHRARAAIAAVGGHPPPTEESSSSLETSTTTQSKQYRRAHAWEFGL
jgi:hypothetical protein